MKFIYARQSLLIAFLMVVALALWMVSGKHAQTEATTAEDDSTNATRTTVVSVRTRAVEAQNVRKEIVLHGTTEPARTVTLRAEIDGRVVEIGAARGALVRRGEVIVRLDARDRHALALEAKATVKQRQLQYEATKELALKNFQSDTEEAQAWADLEAAKAARQRIEIEIRNTEVRASFDGVLEYRPVEVGDYLSAGDEVAKLIEKSPMLIVGHVAQQKMPDIKLGASASASMVTGQTVTGEVSYIAAESDSETRTFRVELEIPNTGQVLAAGITGEIRIPTRSFVAHFLPTSLLSLNSEDHLGVKAVGADSIVEFHEVEIVRASTTGLWVTGLPRTVNIITVGQGFVRAGDRVKAVDESEIDEPQALVVRARHG